MKRFITILLSAILAPALTMTALAGKIAEYEEAEDALKAGAKGKEKKDAQDLIENTNDSFNECQLELDKLFAALQKSLK